MVKVVLYKGLVGKAIGKKRSKLCSSNLKPRKTKSVGFKMGKCYLGTLPI